MTKLALMNKKLIDLNGEEIPNLNMGDIVALILVSGEESTDIVKLYELALRIKKEVVTLDTTDWELIQNKIKDNKQYTVLAKAQILLEIKKYNDELSKDK